MDLNVIEEMAGRDSYSGLVSPAQNWEDDFLGDNTNDVQSTASSVPLGAAVASLGGSSAGMAVPTLLLVAAGIVLAIATLFALGIFIDCRQQKLAEKNKAGVTRKKRTIRLGILRCRRVSEDTTGVIRGAEGPGFSRPPLETIAEVV